MRRLKDDRSFFLYLILEFITFGIYPIYFMWKLIADVNVACEDDGKKTPGILKLILFTLLTCGVYAIVWEYKLVARLNAYCERRKISSAITPSGWLAWSLAGALLCSIGVWVAFYKLIELTNDVMNDYNTMLYRRESEPISE